MDLLREIKDIRDELHMINRILLQQKEVVEKMNLMLKAAKLEPVEWAPRIDDVDRLDEDAQRIEVSVCEKHRPIRMIHADSSSSFVF
jgi:hypothetical protein